MVTKMICFLLMGGMIAVATNSFATESCGTLLVRCEQCHDKLRICKNLGKSEKYWKSMLKYMVSNGAEITKEENSILAQCLSSKADDAQQFCK